MIARRARRRRRRAAGADRHRGGQLTSGCIGRYSELLCVPAMTFTPADANSLMRSRAARPSAPDGVACWERSRRLEERLITWRFKNRATCGASTAASGQGRAQPPRGERCRGSRVRKLPHLRQTRGRAPAEGGPWEAFRGVRWASRWLAPLAVARPSPRNRRVGGDLARPRGHCQLLDICEPRGSSTRAQASISLPSGGSTFDRGPPARACLAYAFYYYKRVMSGAVGPRSRGRCREIKSDLRIYRPG
jgi:hypothetical protein